MNDATGRNTARRRRADTIARCERIMETARRLPLTRDVLADKNMAAALIDRTVHHGRLIRFEGGSYRNEHALMTR